MTMRTLTADSPPTRHGIWKMANEAWGYLSGKMGTADFSTGAKIRESQIKFVEDGHSHNGTAGTAITDTSVEKKNLNLQACPVAWLDYFAKFTENYALLGGHGTATVATSSYSTAYGSIYFDYNPYDTTWATTQPCQLDIRALGAYDDTNFTTNWTIVGFWLTPVRALTNDTAGRQVVQYQWRGTTTGHWVLLVCATTAAGTVSFDYIVCIQEL